MSEREEEDGHSLLKGARSRCLPSTLGSMSEEEEALFRWPCSRRQIAFCTPSVSKTLKK